ncbi:hypothetical protein F183_A24500 [Bryobacterales bacterium F-183]|nr:hypothetical protein F183_A24500 [Bryobacterales bacterium F-183]
MTLEIPRELLDALGSRVTTLSKEQITAEALHRHLWSEGQAAEFLGLDRFAMWQFLKDHQVDPGYTLEDLEQDREVHKRLFETL